jgi:hypothetical protein
VKGLGDRTTVAALSPSALGGRPGEGRARLAMPWTSRRSRSRCPMAGRWRSVSRGLVVVYKRQTLISSDRSSGSATENDETSMASQVWSALPRSSTKRRRQQCHHRRPVSQHLGVQHGAHRTAFPRPSLDRTHQPPAHTSAPVRLHDTEHSNIDPDFPQVAQHLTLSILGRPLQACADVPDDLAVHLGHEPHRVF